MNVNLSQLISYAVIVTMLETSAIYFVVTYEQFTDESGDGFHEMASDKETGQETNDLDTSQWSELDLGGKIQTIFFLIVALVYIPVGIWMLKSVQNEMPYVIVLVGSMSLIAFYVVSRTIDLPIVGMQNDVGTIDVITKTLQSVLVTGCSYVLITKRNLEKSRIRY